MSTQFGVLKPKYEKLREDIDADTECAGSNWGYDLFILVAFRGNGGPFRWEDETASIFANETKVYPLDNSAQGIFTIGDIKKEIKNNE